MDQQNGLLSLKWVLDCEFTVSRPMELQRVSGVVPGLKRIRGKLDNRKMVRQADKNRHTRGIICNNLIIA